MGRLRLLVVVLKRSGAMVVLGNFLLIYFVCGFIVLCVEPDVTTYGDALWFLWAVSTTVGLGDFTAVSLIGRVAAVVCSVSAILCSAIITGVIVDFFNELRQRQLDQSLAEFLDKLERLPELSKEELEDISERVASFRR